MKKKIIAESSENIKKHIKTWDIWIRISHWLLVILVLLCYYTAEIGGLTFTFPGTNLIIANMEIHLWSGLTILTILIFRIFWGFIGSETSRFSIMLNTSLNVYEYIKGLPRNNASFYIGHNPAGAIFVFLIIAALLIQASTGLFSQDDSFFPTTGPLAGFISDDYSNSITKFHKLWWEYVISVMIIVHLLANIFYIIIKKQNLIPAMFTGKRLVPQNYEVKEFKFKSNKLATILLIFALGLVIIISNIKNL
jgi:cytochrome b